MIHIQEVTKAFKGKKALDAVSFDFPQGVHGLLGPNGAGKTTLMRCILGLLPYKGTIETATKQEAIGYVPQHFCMMEELTVEEALEYVALLKGIKHADLTPILQATNLEEQRKKRIKHLSGGMLRRVGIAQALLGAARILLLDEPTVGLDPKERVHLRNLIQALGKERCVLLCTHIVEDVEQIGDSIAILYEGKVLLHEEKEALKQSMDGRIGEVTIPAQALSELEQTVQVLQVHQEGENLRCTVYGDLPAGSVPVAASIEDVYLALTNHA